MTSPINAYISFSDEDRKWYEEIRRHLRPLERDKKVLIAGDDLFRPGINKKEELKKLINRIDVVLILISPSYLTSDYLVENELPSLFGSKFNRQVFILPVIIRACNWQMVSSLANLAAFPKSGRSLSQYSSEEADELLSEIVRIVAQQIPKVSDQPGKIFGEAALSSETKSLPIDNSDVITCKNCSKINPLEYGFCQECGSPLHSKADFDNNKEEAQSQPSEHTNQEFAVEQDIGYGVVVRREASQNELCLSVEQYVQVLATVLSQADGELCFAIFGAWGRGKTTLARELCGRLESQRQPFPQYRSIWFNAWKYRSPPEVWAHLYQRIVDGIHLDGWFISIARTIRSNIARRGLGLLTLALIFLSIGIAPIMGKFEIGYQFIVGLVGALGFAALWAASATYKASSVVRRIWQLYSALPSHQDKLGLQAAIGSDLHYVLHGWIPSPFQGPSAIRNAVHGTTFPHDASVQDHSPGYIAAAAYAVAILSVAIVAYVAISHAHPNFDRHATISPWLLWGIPAAWILGWAAITTWILRAGRRNNRLLLVVDDLDRCLPGQMLDIIEAIKLLAEEPGIRERMQVLILVDEQILSQAIEQRFAHLFNDKEQDYQEKRWILVREHLRKLFVAQLRLAPLSESEVDDLVTKYTAGTVQSLAVSATNHVDSHSDKSANPNPASKFSEQEDQLQEQAHSSQPERIDTPSSSHRDSERPPQEPSEVNATFWKNTLSGNILFTPNEIAVLRRYGMELTRGPFAERTGPRTIRSFIFRYQLARLLLRSLKLETPPEVIAASVYSSDARSDHAKLTDKAGLDYRVRRICEQVTEFAPAEQTTSAN